MSCPHAKRVCSLQTIASYAAASVEQRKLDRYGEAVLLFSLETYARIGYKGRETLERLARDACLYGATSKSPGLFIRKWQSEMDIFPYFTHADVLLQSRGANHLTAGPSAFPIGIYQRAKSAAVGDREELHDV